MATLLARPARVSKRVLVVDDLSYMRDIQVLILKEAGYTATALAGAREALDRLAELAPDLILLDLSMPGMDGRQFLRWLRALPQWKSAAGDPHDGPHRRRGERSSPTARCCRSPSVMPPCSSAFAA